MQTEVQETPFKHRKKPLSDRDDQTLEQVSQRGCRNIHPRFFQNLPREGPGQPALAVTAFSSRVNQTIVRSYFQPQLSSDPLKFAGILARIWNLVVPHLSFPAPPSI